MHGVKCQLVSDRVHLKGKLNSLFQDLHFGTKINFIGGYIGEL